MGTVARYIFSSSTDAEQCMEQLWRRMSGGFSRGGNEIYIEVSCSDLQLASQICRACGGRLGG
ncbi:MAG: hypothetical protein COT74_11660 [Bdellovibrionales bacterium CG10_big_fil_rev_8_21_14_0_10_45_34]|nr:MAG: hypothetical protein COT74_11660 [Bdellovibrionales bacterium CG10_big_fil_rev_8_21_14_0_10_45_34]